MNPKALRYGGIALSAVTLLLIAFFISTYLSKKSTGAEVNMLIESSVSVMQAGDYAQAVLLLKKANSLRPDSFQVCVGLMDAYELMRHYDDAIAQVKLCKEIAARNAAGGLQAYLDQKGNELVATREATRPKVLMKN